MLALLVPLLAIQANYASAPVVAVDPTKALGTCSCESPAISNQLFGFITTNTVLTYASPGPIYDVLGDLVVNPGVALTIEPGVTLRFASNQDILQGGDYPALTEIDVRGSLIADASS